MRARAALVERVDGLRYLPPYNIPRWRFLAEHVESRELRAAILRLLERRPGPIDRLRGRALWLRRNPVGRLARRLAKRVLLG